MLVSGMSYIPEMDIDASDLCPVIEFAIGIRNANAVCALHVG